MALWVAASIIYATTGVLPYYMLVAAIVALCVVVMIMGLCARGGSIAIFERKLQGSGKKLLSLMKSRSSHSDQDSSESSDQLRALEEAYARQAQEESCWSGPLWRKTILMGEKCEPPEFSGLILYDKDGNRISEFPPKLSKAASIQK